MHKQLIQKIGQIGVPIKNLERALSFYRDTLGLPLLFQTGGMAFFNLQGLSLMLTLPEKEEFAHPSSIIYFQVENIEEAYEAYLAKGVIFRDKPHLIAKVGNTETWMTFFHDTEGNTHALKSEVHIV